MVSTPVARTRGRPWYTRVVNRAVGTLRSAQHCEGKARGCGLRKLPPLGAWKCTAATALACLLCMMITLASGGRYSWTGSEASFAAAWKARYAGVLATPAVIPPSLAQAAPSLQWDRPPLAPDAPAPICVGVMSDRRGEPIIFTALRALVEKRAVREVPLRVVVFATPPDGSYTTVAAAVAPGHHSSDALALAGFTVVRMDKAFPPNATAPQKYGRALQWMQRHDYAACRTYLMLEDDALAGAAWDAALIASLDRLGAHDGLWLWLKLMMPDNYAGWQGNTATVLSLVGAGVLVGGIVGAGAVLASHLLPDAAVAAVVAGVGAAAVLHATGKQHLPFLSRMASRGIQHYTQPCCIVAQAYNPLTLSLLAPCLAQAGGERHADMALMPCLQALPGLPAHTYMLLPDLFQHIGVVSTKNCAVVGQNCATLRVAGDFLDDLLTSAPELADTATDALALGAPWSPSALATARVQVETWMGTWLAHTAPAPPREEY